MPGRKQRFNDLLAALVLLPHWPGGQFPGAHGYFDRLALLPDGPIRSAFEFGGHYGFGLVTWLWAFPEITFAGWSDNESAFVGSNTACEENIRNFLGERRCQLWYCTNAGETAGIQADLVMVDGDHSYQGCLCDLALALAMRPRVVLVDDMQIGGVAQAVADFSAYTDLGYTKHEVAAGTAVFRPEG